MLCQNCSTNAELEPDLTKLEVASFWKGKGSRSKKDCWQTFHLEAFLGIWTRFYSTSSTYRGQRIRCQMFCSASDWLGPKWSSSCIALKCVTSLSLLGCRTAYEYTRYVTMQKHWSHMSRQNDFISCIGWSTTLNLKIVTLEKLHC